jgi:phosphatidylserine decarboxylase
MVRDGYFYGLALAVVGAILWLVTRHWVWAVPALLFAAFFLWFFRDPSRTIPTERGLIVSPADGKVSSVARVRTPDGERLRLSIFLSVFDVHVNRSPVEGILREVRYRKGEYLNAMNPVSADRNEQNLAVVDCIEGYQVVFVQIAGLLARRIVFSRKPGDYLERGERVGLIKFGSRTDLLLPSHAEALVKPGDRVRGGASVLARIATPDTDLMLASISAEMLV